MWRDRRIGPSTAQPPSPHADPAQRARLLFVSGAIEGRHGWLKDGITALQQAAALSESASLTLEFLLEAAALTFYAGDYDAVVAVARRAQEVSCQTDSERFIVGALTAVAAEIGGDHDRGAVLAAEAIELAEGLDDPVCLVWAAWTAARAGGAGDGLSYASRAVDIARERGLMTVLSFALQMQADGLIAQSRFDLAYATAEEGWRLALDIGQPWAASWNLANLAIVDACAGPSSRRERTPRSCTRWWRPAARHWSLPRWSGLWGCSILVVGGRRRRSTVCWSRSPRHDTHHTRCSSTRCPTRSRPRFEPIGCARWPSTSTASRPGCSSSLTRRASRCSRAAGRWSENPMPADTSRRRSSSRRSSHRLTEHGPSCRMASGCDASTAALTPAAISAPRSSCSISSRSRPGKRGTLGAARQRRDRAQARSLHPRSAHAAGAADLTPCRLREDQP